ncbi:MAG TPA: EAL domain-containing protein [Steroidobacteraceae bacterium]|nr:EAL domain-containing protein [Steroidobacteraceae bacterium]
MRLSQTKYLVALLCVVLAGVAALLWQAGRSHDVPLWILALGAAGAGCAILLPGLWSWRQRIGQNRAVYGLIGAAADIARGEFRRSLVRTRRDRLGELEHAFENMRVALRNTTYTRDYLHSILNSMTDAVFVTAPGGVVRIANEAACRLTGYAEHELTGRNIESLLAETERTERTERTEHGARSGRAEAPPVRAAREAGEALLRTRAGQTIPVSFVGSTIAAEDPQFQGQIYVARDITERKRTERRIRYLARYDALTKIPNRMLFQHLLQQAIARSRRGGRGLALLYIDMDRFKEVNDTFGHESGDRALETLTERLTQVLHGEAVLGRLAGDELALFIEAVDAEPEEAAGPVAQLARAVLHAASGEAMHIAQQEVFLTISIGIAMCPRDADNVIELIRNADAAMYYAKQNGGNSYAFYSPEMNAASVERLMLKSKLRRAVERDEFVVRYQPKVDLTDGWVVGAEALLRWRLPGHGDIPPAQFIPIAEETNLIGAIGQWVLERVCSDFCALRRHIADPGRISLNLSLKQLKQASFILNCRSVFERHAVPTDHLELEITETTLMADPQRTVQLLNQLHDMGLHLSIDDFGTGYSSLSALQQFPIGTLKIDQSFVRGAADDAAAAVLVRTIIDMGHSLGMEVVAEGVETPRQLAFLRQCGCDLGQGRLFGEARSLEELSALLQAQERGAAAFAQLLPAAATTRSHPA